MTEQQPAGIDRNLTSYGDPGFSRYLRRAFLASAGYVSAELERPIVGIASTVSDFTPCHRQMPELIDAIRRGVLEAGGLPFVFPTMSLGETFLSPTSMLFRNLMAMETEELLTSQPMDSVVLVGGCDKTVPAQVMAAVSANVPAILTVVGPMWTGSWHGERLGACTDCRRYWAEYRAHALTEGAIDEITTSLCPTAGTCMVMGTASTMACVVEALGLILPGGATLPAASGARLSHGVQTGRAAVRVAQQQLRPRDILGASAFKNALVVLSALGGSTNAIIHLLAIALRAGVDLALDDFDAVARDVPLLVDCKPSGKGYLEDFDRAGGMRVLMKALEPLLDGNARSVDGTALHERLADVEPPQSWQTTIHTLEAPLGERGALAVLRGSLAPDGAVLKVSAASRELLHHTGPAIVFESPEDAAVRLSDPDLAVTRDHVLVLRNAGPVAAGMPEAGSLPIPVALAEAGVKDMIRISDARMSGTGYGTVILHCSPEAAIGGPLALVRDGDLIAVDVDRRRLDLLVDPEELEHRRSQLQAYRLPIRGWRRLYSERVLQAHLGADLDFLAESGAPGRD